MWKLSCFKKSYDRFFTVIFILDKTSNRLPPSTVEINSDGSGKQLRAIHKCLRHQLLPCPRNL
ncbi:hypothetical protein SAMN05421636_104403 [Pricia antarctica]|uniref:Uncharacterized protein n=1 Tax=Pricia antarctica TaxID=641691 RepID=A0A1G7C3B4_9FLAO|nr:hypothetical protein SAMN05421636_104403 [Pricia antarctica]